MERNIPKIISEMTLEQKASLCSGASFWRTKAIPEHGIPAIMMTDGSHGLRKQQGSDDDLGINESIPSTCFPTAAGLACSWNRKLIEKVGIALGKECQADDVQIILGPGTNIKRSPLCGRNFEYFSEDPYLSSELAKSHIIGVQSQGIGTSIKHFAANTQETNRFNIDTVVDERTLRELYFASFENAVIEAKPWTLMCAYNKLNGTFCSENKIILTDVLRCEWGFDGFVLSDWGAVSKRDLALQAGLDLEMPTSEGIGMQKILDAVNNGTFKVEVLDSAVERLLKIIFRAVDSKKKDAAYSKSAHHTLAKKVASESMVLLKNKDNILPLLKNGKIAIIGTFAKMPRYQGAGSSRVNPTRLDIPLDVFRKVSKKIQIAYSPGYSLESYEIDNDLIKRAKVSALLADVAIIFVGLPEKFDTEGSDRTHLRLPDNQNALIEGVAEVQKNIIVVLINGSAVEMPWIHKVKGILDTFLGGQAMADAVAGILFGDINPSGKLAETFPEKLSHNPSFINFPGEIDRVEFKEGLFVGYKHYDKVEIDPLFPFGYGLSYTKFEYSELTVNKKEFLDTEIVKVCVKIKNTGKQAGKEIVQLYVRDVESSVIRPIKELKGFEKITLKPGEEKFVTFTLKKRAFAYYSVRLRDWHVESGDFEILIGKSSKEILLKETVAIKSTVKIRNKYTSDSTIEDIKAEPAAELIVALVTEYMNSIGVEGIGVDMNFILSNIKLSTVVSMGQGLFTQEMLDELLNTMNEGEASTSVQDYII